MDVNGCHIVCSLNASSEDGFEATVSRYVGVRFLQDGIPKDAVKVSRGPFMTTLAAVIYAHSWNDANTPPPMPTDEKKDAVDDSEKKTEAEAEQTDGKADAGITVQGTPFTVDADALKLDNPVPVAVDTDGTMKPVTEIATDNPATESKP